jgi:hypothetical protein
MRPIIFAALAAAGSITALTTPATAYAAPATAPRCVVVHDHITKPDNGHGTPAEWADLSLSRTTTVCGSSVKLVDAGVLWTRPGAGAPAGVGGQITHRVRGNVHGAYALTVSGGHLAHRHGDTSLSSTDYVRSLFSDGTTVTGGTYAWLYATRCEKWLDASSNGDGQGDGAGNITGKRCPKPTPSSSPSTEPTAPSSGGDGPTPTTVPVGAPQTGDGTTPGDSHDPVMIAIGIVLVVLSGLGVLALRMRHRGHHR